jgi:guanine deaminase
MKKENVTKEDRARFMQMAVDLSQYALDSKSGGPFGAIIVKNGKIIGSSGNQVMKNCDPTAHAEVMAIRDACENLGSIDLSNCEIYSSAEPCPLCTAAIYWSKLEAVYYSNTEEDSLEYGFVDKEILAEIRLPKNKRILPFKQLKNPFALKVFKRSLEI